MIVFHLCLSDRKSLRVSRTLLSILADLNNTIVWILFTRVLISKSSSPCTSPLVIISSALITTGITVTFMFHSFLVPEQASCTYCRLGRDCKIHRLFLCRVVRPPNKCPGYDTKQSDGEVPVILELWGMWSTPLLPSLPGLLCPGVVASDKGPIYGLNRTKPGFLHYTDFCI